MLATRLQTRQLYFLVSSLKLQLFALEYAKNFTPHIRAKKETAGEC